MDEDFTMTHSMDPMNENSLDDDVEAIDVSGRRIQIMAHLAQLVHLNVDHVNLGEIPPYLWLLHIHGFSYSETVSAMIDYLSTASRVTVIRSGPAAARVIIVDENYDDSDSELDGSLTVQRPVRTIAVNENYNTSNGGLDQNLTLNHSRLEPAARSIMVDENYDDSDGEIGAIIPNQESSTYKPATSEGEAALKPEPATNATVFDDKYDEDNEFEAIHSDNEAAAQQLRTCLNIAAEEAEAEAASANAVGIKGEDVKGEDGAVARSVKRELNHGIEESEVPNGKRMRMEKAI